MGYAFWQMASWLIRIFLRAGLHAENRWPPAHSSNLTALFLASVHLNCMAGVLIHTSHCSDRSLRPRCHKSEHEGYMPTALRPAHRAETLNMYLPINDSRKPTQHSSLKRLHPGLYCALASAQGQAAWLLWPGLQTRVQHVAVECTGPDRQVCASRH